MEKVIRRFIMSDPVNAQSTTQGVPGIFGENTVGGDGVFGHGVGTGRGVVGVSDNHTGVEGNSTNGDGVFGRSTGTGRGVVGVSDNHTGVEGNSTNAAGVFGRGNPAGFFEGDVVITGSLSLQGLSVADLFRLVQQLEQQVSDIQSVLDRVKSILHL
jgi:hypothetical protein